MKDGNLIERLAFLCQDEDVKQSLQRYIDLIIFVDKNYEHISQLETLGKLFDGGLSDYYKEYHSAQNEVAEIMGTICNITKINHYREKDDLLYPSVYDVQIELFGKV